MGSSESRFRHQEGWPVRAPFDHNDEEEEFPVDSTSGTGRDGR